MKQALAVIINQLGDIEEVEPHLLILEMFSIEVDFYVAVYFEVC